MNRCFSLQHLSAALLFAVGISFFGLPARGSETAAVCTKAIPEITFSNFSPPFKDYDYFQNRRTFPFDFNATSFSLVNAWWLAEASMLVYADETYVRRRFARAGLFHLRFFNRSSTQCFVASNDRFAIIAFRGSEIWKRGEPFDPRRILADFTTDIDLQRTEWYRGGRVHRGFKTALDLVWDELKSEVETLQARGLKLWITGHSLGAALAVLAGDWLPEVQGVYTFGSPRVGDNQFQAAFRPRTYRIVNNRDIVTRVPPKGLFRHVGERISIDSQGRVLYHRNTFENQPDPILMDDTEIDEPCREHTASHATNLIPRSIRDHVPLLYAIYLWNELAVSRDATGNPFTKPMRR